MRLLTVPALMIAVLWFSNCDKTKTTVREVKNEIAAKGDISFAKSTFESLVAGDSKVATKIDWPVFTSNGKNLAAEYSAEPNSVAKEKYIGNFITQFSTSFRETGGSIADFSNWRVVMYDPQRTEVAADKVSGDVLTVIVATRDGVERVSSINIVRP